ncbi:MAG TPA: MBG domain-containing protein [Mycobacteriales bacterium]|nr:MBG domain-containing protein [Mycobacteriales bacterium]
MAFGRDGARASRGAALGVSTVLLLSGLSIVGGISAATTAAALTVTGPCVSNSGTSYTVPATGVTQIDVQLEGAPGAGWSEAGVPGDGFPGVSINGGDGSQYDAQLAVTPGEVFTYGFIAGGAGGQGGLETKTFDTNGPRQGPDTGAGGSGEFLNISVPGDTCTRPLIVAGGGGSAGGGFTWPINTGPVYPSGFGGNGDAGSGANGGGDGAQNDATDGGHGSPGLSTVGGAGGAKGHSLGTCHDGSTGETGAFEQGGDGAQGPDNAAPDSCSSGWGAGGGGGGYYNGGGGGSAYDNGGTGGGGGGSSYVNPDIPLQNATSVLTAVIPYGHGADAPSVVPVVGATIALKSGMSPSAHGSAVTFTATVTNIDGSAVAGGTVTFKGPGFDGISTDPIVAAVNGAGVATISPTLTVDGTDTVSASYSGTSLVYSGATAVERPTNPVTISQVVAPAITFSSMAPTGAVVGAGTYAVTASDSAGLTVSLSIDSTATSICSISGSTVSFKAVGTCLIDANQAAGGSFLAAPQVQQSFTIGEGLAQTITFTTNVPTTPVVQGQVYNVAATSTGASGKPVTFSAPLGDPCSVESTGSGGTGRVQISEEAVPGTCHIDANQAAGNGFGAAAQVEQTISVPATPNLIGIFYIPSGVPTHPAVGTTTTIAGDAPGAIRDPVVFSLDSSSTSCSLDNPSFPTGQGQLQTRVLVHFTAPGPCVIDANQDGDTTNDIPAASQLQTTLTVAGAPGPPTDVSVTGGSPTQSPALGDVTVDWTAPASEGGGQITGYNVYVGTQPGAESTTPANSTPLAATATSYDVTNLTSGVTYYVTVTAINADGASSPSTEASGVLQNIPTLAWAQAAPITFGSSLTGILDPTASVNGTFTFETAGSLTPIDESTIFATGFERLLAVFTPQDTSRETNNVVFMTLEVDPAPLTVTVTGTQTYGGSPTFLHAETLPSGVTISGTLTCTSVTGAAISPRLTVGSHLVIAGTCSGLSLIGAGASNYTLSYSGNAFVVSAAPVTVTAPSPSVVYGAALPALTPVVAGLVSGDSLTGQPTCSAASPHANVDTYAITCAGASAGSNYSISYVAGTLTVTPAQVTVTSDSFSIVHGDTDPTFTTSVIGLVTPDKLTSPAMCGVSGAHSHVSTYPITCTGASAGSNYTVVYGAGTLTVTAAAGVVTPDPQEIAFGDPVTFTFTVSLKAGDSLVTQPTCGVSGAHTDAGTYTIMCSGGSSPDYTLTYATATLEVDKAPVVVTANDQTKTYGTPDPTFDAAVSGVSSLTTAPTCVVTGAHTNVNTYPITCSAADAGSNYAITYQPGTLTVTKADVNVVAPSSTMTYGDPVSGLALSPSFVTLAGMDTQTSAGFGSVSCSTTATANATGVYDAGSYPVTCTGPGASSNYVPTYVPGMLTVAQLGVSVTPVTQEITFGDTDPLFSYTIPLRPGDVLASNPTCGVSGMHTDAGSYTIACSGGGSPNYLLSYNAATLTVDKQRVVVTADNQIRDYGATDPTFTYQPSGLLHGDPLTTPAMCGVSGTHSDAGSYDITCSGADAGKNYDVSYQPGTLTVDKIGVTITAPSPTMTYGDAASSVSFAPTIDGLVPGDSASSTGLDSVACAPSTMTTGSGTYHAGSYPTTCSGPASLTNYTPDYEAGTLSVARAAGVVTPDDQMISYGDPDPSFTFTVALLGTDSLKTDPTCGVSGAHSAAGTYPIACSGGGSPDYALSDQTATLTVNKVGLTVTAPSPSMTYGDAASSVSFAPTIDGLVRGDSATSAGLASLVCSPSAMVTSRGTYHAGSYPVTCPGPSTLPNYTPTYLAGTLTVSKAAAVVTADAKTITYADSDPTFGFSVSPTTGDVLTSSPACGVTGAHSEAGQYSIYCTGGASDDYTLSYEPAKLTVAKATVDVVAPSPDTLDDQPALPSFVPTYSTLRGADTSVSAGFGSVVCSTTAMVGVGGSYSAGSYPVTCAGPTTTTNYTPRYVAGVLTVGATSTGGSGSGSTGTGGGTGTGAGPSAPDVVTPDSQTITYGEPDPKFTFTVTLQPGDSLSSQPTCGVTGPHSDAGTYPITCTGAASSAARRAAAGERSIKYGSGTLTVERAPLVVTAQRVVRARGVTNPRFHLVLRGLVNGDTAATAVSGRPVFRCAARARSLPGVYPVQVTLGTLESANYTLVTRNGRLRVTRR